MLETLFQTWWEGDDLAYLALRDLLLEEGREIPICPPAKIAGWETGELYAEFDREENIVTRTEVSSLVGTYIHYQGARNFENPRSSTWIKIYLRFLEKEDK